MRIDPRFLSCSLFLIFVSLLPPQANAGLLDDDEARKAILALSVKMDTVFLKIDERISELSARIDMKAEKNIGVDMLNDREQNAREMASLRGEVEILGNAISDVRKNQKDLFIDLDSRIKTVAPQRQLIEGNEAELLRSEKRSFDDALAMSDSGDYQLAFAALQEFIRRYPRSAYVPNALYRIGTTYFAQGKYKEAIKTQEGLLAKYGESSDAPNAMLSISSSYVMLNEKKNAKSMLQQLIRNFPESSAASIGKQRLLTLK